MAVLYRLMADYVGRRTLLVSDSADVRALRDCIAQLAGDNVHAANSEALVRGDLADLFDVVLLHGVSNVQLKQGLAGSLAPLPILLASALRHLASGGVLAGTVENLHEQGIIRWRSRVRMSAAECRRILALAGIEDVDVFRWYAPSAQAPGALLSPDFATNERVLRDHLSRTREYMNPLRYALRRYLIGLHVSHRAFPVIAFRGRCGC